MLQDEAKQALAHRGWTIEPNLTYRWTAHRYSTWVFFNTNHSSLQLYLGPSSSSSCLAAHLTPDQADLIAHALHTHSLTAVVLAGARALTPSSTTPLTSPEDH
jgi:hypothetical protein